jgi:glycosyltransferase involved in cell wall biosynthesis
VALFARSLGGGGGVERVLVHLAGALAARGARVDLVLARAQGRFLRELSPAVRVVDLAAPPALRALPALARAGCAGLFLPVILRPGTPRVLGAIPALARWLRAERPHALLSALDYANAAALVARRLAGTGTRTLVSVHNHVSASVASSGRQRLLRVVPELARRLYPEADAVVAVSDGVARDLVELTGLPPGRVVRIYNPVLVPRLDELARAPLAHPWFAAGAPPVLLGAGKLKRQKDFHTLIRAFALLRARRPARLVILGEGPLEGSLRGLARSLGVEADVALPGFVENPYPFMRGAAAFALSSLFEGFGNVLVEAMACGCPVVSTDCPSGPSEILEGGRWGELVPVGDAQALAAALARTLDDPPASAELEKRASCFSAAASAAEYERLLLAPARQEPGAARSGKSTGR